MQRALNYSQAEVNLTETGRPADLDDLEAIDALTLIESAQVCLPTLSGAERRVP